jgi:hypothetical protein
LKKYRQRRKNIFKFTKNHHNYLYKYERVIQIFLLSYFEYCQIWLNVLMGDRHFRNIPPPRHLPFDCHPPKASLPDLMRTIEVKRLWAENSIGMGDLPRRSCFSVCARAALRAFHLSVCNGGHALSFPALSLSLQWRASSSRSNLRFAAMVYDDGIECSLVGLVAIEMPDLWHCEGEEKDQRNNTQKHACFFLL